MDSTHSNFIDLLIILKVLTEISFTAYAIDNWDNKNYSYSIDDTLILTF